MGDRMHQKLQDTAIELMNEDLREISGNIEKLLTEVPEEAKNQLRSLRTEIYSIEKALEIIPDKFDEQFKDKMNQLLDAVKELENHSNRMPKAIEEGISDSFIKQNERISKIFKERKLCSNTSLFIYGIACALSGGVIAGLTLILIGPLLL